MMIIIKQLMVMLRDHVLADYLSFIHTLYQIILSCSIRSFFFYLCCRFSGLRGEPFEPNVQR